MNRHYAAVAERARHRCEYCGAPEAVFNVPFEVEHIRPLVHGGSHVHDNLALSCRSCNL
jgi:5-methylcytosine-specific restriction endonuclease McrA